MSELYPLIQDLALILITAAIVTILFKMIRQPLVLGYIVAGFLISPYFEWLPTVVDTANISIWAEIGVIFLLFALGLEFSFKKLMKVGGTSTITAIVEVVSMLVIGYAVGQFLEWGYMDSLFLGGMLAMSSTTIIIKAFNDLGLRTQKFTGVVFGILVVEDLVAILMMVLLSTLAISNQFAGVEMAGSVLRLGFFLALWFLLGIFMIPTFLKKIRSMVTDEILLIVVSGLCLGMVVVAEHTGFSAALGAFIMGSILAETVEVEKIEHLIEPIKNFFAAVFFVSVGMMVNPEMLVTYAFPIIVITLATVIGKAIFSSLGVLLSGQPLKIAIQSGFSLAQIGEFAFIIASLGLSLGVTSDFLYPIVVAVSVVTTFLTPYSIKAAEPVYRALDKHLPEKVKQWLNQYSSGNQTVNRESEWRKLVKTNAVIIVICTVILTGICLISFTYLSPFMRENVDGAAGALIGAAVTIAAMMPFLSALLIAKLKTESFNTLWDDRRFNRGLLMSVIIIRQGLVALFVAAVLMHYTRLGLALLALATMLVVIFAYVLKSPRLHYTQMEERFIDNLNARENGRVALHKEKMTQTLLSKDMHFGTFDVSPDSEVVGKELKELQFRGVYGVNIVSIIRGVNRINIPKGDEILYPLDRLIVLGSDSQLRRFRNEIEKEKIISEESGSKEVVLRQFTIDGKSPLLGKTIRDSNIRSNDKCLVVGIEQENDPDLILDIDHKFESGDVIWIVGEKERIDTLAGNCV